MLIEARVSMARPCQAYILEQAPQNAAYRTVLSTGVRSQLVLMSISPRGDIGLESHASVEQLNFITSGRGKAVVNGIETPVTAGDVVAPPPQASQNIRQHGT